MMERTEVVAVEISNLIVNTQTMTLATLNSAGVPEASMASFIYEATSHLFYTAVTCFLHIAPTSLPKNPRE